MSSPFSRYGKPVYLPRPQGSRPIPLCRRRLQAGSHASGYDEHWLQQLLFETPEILPVGEIDPTFARAIPLCQELPTNTGYVDLCYITDRGKLCIVECKLWRNPEARRRVIAQILDYAAEISRWSYNDLCDSVRSARGDVDKGNIPFDLVQQQDETADEATFVDNVARNLRSGQFLLMVVGDGIREELEQIVEYLKRSAGIRFTFALVELAIFDLPQDLGGGAIVEPRVLARTVEIVRSVVALDEDESGIVFQDPPANYGPNKNSRKGLTEEEFWRSQGDDTLEKRTRDFIKRYERRDGCTVDYTGHSYILRWMYAKKNKKINLGYFYKDGRIYTDIGKNQLSKWANLQIGRDYYDSVAGLVPHDRTTKISELLNQSEKWLAAIDKAIDDSERFEEDGFTT